MLNPVRGLTAFQGEVALRLAIAAVAGALVGVERELRDQAAGLRTHMLVGVGACLFTIVSAYGFDAVVAGRFADSTHRYDVTRVASNIVTGVGFLGAGAIIRHGLSVRGLTTAASLWVTAAVGTAVGVGMYWATVVSIFITIVSLAGLRAARMRIRRAGAVRQVMTLRARSEETLNQALDTVRGAGYRVRRLSFEEGADQTIGGRVELRAQSNVRPETVMAAIARLPGLLEVDWDEA